MTEPTYFWAHNTKKEEATGVEVKLEEMQVKVPSTLKDIMRRYLSYRKNQNTYEE